ncbi:Epidermal patterning factor-like protein [Psidium guajava]|nr:Epidermal patterning factor-like protein [Psidium guajava]
MRRVCPCCVTSLAKTRPKHRSHQVSKETGDNQESRSASNNSEVGTPFFLLFTLAF